MKKLILMITIILSMALIAGCGDGGSAELIFDAEGTYDYAEEESVSEDVHITADGVVLTNMVINSDLYIDESVGDGHVELINVEVNGTVYVYGGGLNTLFAKGSWIKYLLGYNRCRIEAAEDTKIDKVVVKEPGMVLENHEDATEAFPDVTIEIDEPTEEDEPVVLDGDFDEVEAKEGSNVVIEEETVVRHYYLTCGDYDGPGYYTTRTKVKKGAKVEKMDIDGEAEIDNEGEILEKNYGDNYQGSAPAVLSANLSVSSSGDYSIEFMATTEGTIYYMVQPWFESAGVTRTPEQVLNKVPYEFEAQLSPGENPDDINYMVSAKSVDVTSTDDKAIATGYMGDAFGSRPPADDEIQFDSVVWYVLKDVDGTYSEVGKIVYR